MIPGEPQKGWVLFLTCQHWNKLSQSHVCMGSMARSWQKLADGSPCAMSQFCLITMRICKTKPAKTLACSKDGVSAGSREEACGCSQVTGDLAPPSLDQQANETHGAGESMFSRPHGTQLSKIDDFFFCCCCSNMQCPSVKMTRRLWRI